MVTKNLHRPAVSVDRAAAGRRRRWRCALVVIVSLCLAGGVRQARAAGARPLADVWTVSTRRLPGICRLPEHARLDVERLSGGDCGRWERASVAELLADADVPLVVFIHGNRYAASEAKSEGVRLARLVAAACPDAGRERTLVITTPSQQDGHLLYDVRKKYDRAHADGHYLAWLLGQLDPGRDVAVVGYSYGAIVGLEALRDLATPQRAGRAGVTPWSDRPGRTHLVFVAPAVRCDALAPRGPYRETLAAVDRLTLISNSADFALRFFDHVDRDVGAEALGVTGMPRRWVPRDVEYCAVDGAAIVGHQHRLPPFLASGPLARRIAAGAVGGLGDDARR